jgi:AAA15 family ATPase/GTPase
MLLRFTVENVLSFRDRTDLSFVATARNDAPNYRLPTQHAKHGVLPVVGLWGANASGKSNLLVALTAFADTVATSFARRLPNEAAPWAPWMARIGPADPPSLFEVELVDAKDVRYVYGFTQDARGYAKEWLTRWSGSRPQQLFERDRDGAVPWYFNPVLGPQKRCKEIAVATRANCLFLSTAAQFNHLELLTIYREITQKVRPDRADGADAMHLFAADDPLLAAEFRGLLLAVLAAADLGVVGVEVGEQPAKPEPAFFDELSKDVADLFRQEFHRKRFELRLAHRTDTSEHWLAPAAVESTGTWVLMMRLSEILTTLRTGALWVVDEFNAALHPDLAAALLSLFCSPTTNPNGAQILFASHDRTALDALRSDSIGLVDKDAQGRSSLAYASDYKQIRSRDNLRLAYEQGRIRGVPVLGDLVDLFARGVRHGA